MTENIFQAASSGIGQVITRFGADVLIETAGGELLRCTARRKLDNLACGDRVQWEGQAQGNAAVTALLPRQNVLERPDFRGRLRPVAANIDLLIVVTSWQPAPLWEMLDRYLIAANRLHADVLLVMNKADLRSTHATAEAEACLAEYVQMGCDVLHVAADQNQGIADILAAIRGRTAIVVGQSGVGKSSIATQLLPDTDIRVGSISETGEGRHTTTSAMLYRLPTGGALIDSPGVRDFGLIGLDFATLETGFPEFRPFLGECRFHNCSHNHEPGCAIKAAVSAGKIPPRRFARYLSLLATV
ncbi:MAG: ribosome small subunit-dependent GTPase [Pseudomonadota bacterium]|jgi:ribosome biogenesis GTPase|uniref:Small ribosomal subunit biogenesis GTPase RsgA n=1 Tax=Thiothrix fructosivorans TaxID=111770 RepID=A0A8B0SME7_9GAMM|nr:ribosome small subunit-dependent GTPase A [Thiothrix fructosivorans]MBO0612865.1 ribosome small subunit-dependent GTPase A [Thiothrix fructosivorans]QTX11680.1 ribosome small subunit-dependent GTPase A [Thiothrix fructosivorans]